MSGAAPVSRLEALRFRLSGDALRILYRPPDAVAFLGEVALSRRGAIAEFLRRDLRPAGPVRVRGRRGPGGLRIDGGLGPVESQRLRNFLMQAME